MRLAVAWADATDSFALSVPDDAYYYFTIARNLARGEGVTFDGLSPTNGFHPLWLALITPLWRVSAVSHTLPVHLALSLGALLDLGTLVGVWHLAAHLTRSRSLAGLSVLCYAYNPYNAAASVNGLETSLGAVLLVWSLALYWHIRSQVASRRRDWLVLGLLWALLPLARTDYVIIICPCLLDLLWRKRRHLTCAWTACFGGILWIPWLFWNLSAFGTFTQVSGQAYPYYLHTIWHSDIPCGNGWYKRAEWLMAYSLIWLAFPVSTRAFWC